MRFDIDTYKEIADSLTRNKSRSILTGFGIFWGVFMLLFLMGGGQGLKEMLSNNFKGFATNTTVIFPNQTTKAYKGFQKGRFWSMTFEDVDRLKMVVPELDVVTPSLSKWGESATRGANTFTGPLHGVWADYCKIEEPLMKYGRYINEIDVLQERKVCVIGKRVYTSLFPEGGDPCGQRIKIGPLYYRIIGVNYSSSNMSINGTPDQSIYIPLPVMQKVFHQGNKVTLICLVAKPGVIMSSIEGHLRQIMSRQHSFDLTDKPAMGVLHTEEVFALMDNLFKGVNFLILLVGLGTILAGAIGVSNIMMVTVNERTIEIGIRRAIGATPKDILSQIITESISLTLVSGSGGIVFSVLLLNLLEIITKHQAAFQINFWTAITATAFLALLGVVAGLAPALRAMNIKPVEAMRDE